MLRAREPKEDAEPRLEQRLWIDFDPFATASRNDGVDGAPNGISVPRWSLSSTHLKGSRPWASLSGI